MASLAVLESPTHHDPTRQDAVRRVRAAYDAQPALSLTVLQARRLFGLDPDTADAVLRRLTSEDFLVLNLHAQYVRVR